MVANQIDEIAVDDGRPAPGELVSFPGFAPRPLAYGNRSEGRLDLALFSDPEAGWLYGGHIRVDQPVEAELADVVRATHER